jgi:hypothetical protein
MRPCGYVEALRGICGTKVLDIENTRFTTFTPIRSVCGADSILAAVQILTPGFSGWMWVGAESGVVVLKTMSCLESSNDEKVEDYNARNA